MFDYSKLEGRIVEKYKNKVNFCKATNTNYGTFTSKVRGDSEFSASEIINIMNALDVPYDKIPEYFFTLKV